MTSESEGEPLPSVEDLVSMKEYEENNSLKGIFEPDLSVCMTRFSC